MPSTMNAAFSTSCALPVLGSNTANSAFAPSATPLRRRRTVLPPNDSPASRSANAAAPRIHMHVERIETGQLNSSIFLHSAKTAQSQSPAHAQQQQQRQQRSSNALANKSYPHPVVVLSFITENCRACMYAKAGFERLAREFTGLPTHRNARFYEIDVSNVRNHRLGQQLGITAVPSFQLYAYKSDESDADSAAATDSRVQQQQGAFGVIDEMVGPRVVGKIRDRLMHYCSDAFDLNDYVFDD